MKKLAIIATFIFAAQTIWAQTVVTAADFNSNPQKYVGQTITIANVKLISNTPPKTTLNAPCGKVLNTSVQGGGRPSPGQNPSGGTVTMSSPAHCNDIPNFHLTKWELVAGKQICVQMCNQLSNSISSISSGSTVKSMTIEVKETMYLLKSVTK
jgi:hypothetical protein